MDLVFYKSIYLKENFYLNFKDKVKAKARIKINDNVLILKNSWVKEIDNYENLKSYQINIVKKNKELIKLLLKENIIEFRDNKYIFIKDYDYFNSLSGYASFFINIHTNGKEAWKTKENKTFKELYDN